jgi:hypothetical protein
LFQQLAVVDRIKTHYEPASPAWKPLEIAPQNASTASSFHYGSLRVKQVGRIVGTTVLVNQIGKVPQGDFAGLVAEAIYAAYNYHTGHGETSRE